MNQSLQELNEEIMKLEIIQNNSIRSISTIELSIESLIK
jgi:hypothetical protein